MDDMSIVPIVLISLAVLIILSSFKGPIGKVAKGILKVESCLEWVVFIVLLIFIADSIFGFI